MLKVSNGDIPEVIKYKTESRNILPLPYSETSRIEEGITYTVNDNGTILVNGTATMVSNFFLNKALKLEIGRTYTISSNCNVPFTIEDTSITQVVNCINTPQTFIAQFETYYVFLTVGKGSVMNNVLVKPQLEIGSTATEYLPYGQQSLDVEKVIYNNETVWVKPVNLIKQPYNSGSSSITGITWTINDANSISANGTATANSTFNICEIDVSNKQVKLSGCPENGSGSTYELYALDTTNNQIYHDYGEGVIFTPANKITIYARVYNTSTVDIVFRPKLFEYI
mgnify:CR=1 FL=1